MQSSRSKLLLQTVCPSDDLDEISHLPSSSTLHIHGVFVQCIHAVLATCPIVAQQPSWLSDWLAQGNLNACIQITLIFILATTHQGIDASNSYMPNKSYGVLLLSESINMYKGLSQSSWQMKFLLIFILCERERPFICRLSCSNASHSQGWARMKSEAQSTIWVAHMGDRDPSTWAITCCLPDCMLAGN